MLNSSKLKEPCRETYVSSYFATECPSRSTSKHKDEVIRSLFTSGQREQYELDYLYSSQHFEHSRPYRQLIEILQKYNQQAVAFNNKDSGERSNSFNKVKLACVRFLYQEMLTIAVMTEKELKQNNLAEKLKDWFEHLGGKNHFWKGVNIKRKSGITEQDEEANIRAKYISNVFDEIDSYFRKKVEYSIVSPSFDANSSPKKDISSSKCNLPFIDAVIYKREEAKIRQIREIEQQRGMIASLIKQKNKIRESSIDKLKNKYNQNQIWSQQQPDKTIDSRKKTLPLTYYGGSNAYMSKENTPNQTRRLMLKRVKTTEPTLNSVGPINGINLISNKIQ